MFKFCRNVDQGIVISVVEFSFMTPIAIYLLYLVLIILLKLLVFSEPITYGTCIQYI